MPVNKPLRVYHIPQLGLSGTPTFYVSVKDETEAAKVANALADQHLFLLENGIIPDYSNIIGVEMEEDGEWVDYFHEEVGDWDEVEELLQTMSLEEI